MSIGGFRCAKLWTRYLPTVMFNLHGTDWLVCIFCISEFKSYFGES